MILSLKSLTITLEVDIPDTRSVVFEGEGLSDPVRGSDAPLLSSGLTGDHVPLGIREGHCEGVVAPLITPFMEGLRRLSDEY